MRKRLPAAVAVLVAAAAVLFAAPAAIPPAPERWVTDSAGLLSPAGRQALDARLEAYERSSGHQVLVWIGRTTGDVPIEDFAARAFQSWRVGRKGIDDGLVLFIFSEDRKIRFEVGYGLEDKVPDAIASRIIREVMAPRLQADDRDGAVGAGVEAALAAIGAAGGPQPERGPAPERPLSTLQKIVIAAIVIGFLLLLITNPSLAFWLLVNIASSGSRGGGGGGWGGGGFSGGGGRSGGGGATGSW